MALSKTTYISDAWEAFYDRLNSAVVGQSVTLVDTTSVTLSNISSAFPDKVFEQKSNYPILIVESPSASTQEFTLGKQQVNMNLTVEIYTNQAEAADKFFNKILDAIETYKGTFADSGIHSIQLDSTDSDMVDRGVIKIHVRRATFSFVYRYSKTMAY